MKKLILSMFIVLGTMASVSAQTFDFSCDNYASSYAGFASLSVPVLTQGTVGDVVTITPDVGFRDVRGSEDNGGIVVSDVVISYYNVTLTESAPGSNAFRPSKGSLLATGSSYDYTMVEGLSSLWIEATSATLLAQESNDPYIRTIPRFFGTEQVIISEYTTGEINELIAVGFEAVDSGVTHYQKFDNDLDDYIIIGHLESEGVYNAYLDHDLTVNEDFDTLTEALAWIANGFVIVTSTGYDNILGIRLSVDGVDMDSSDAQPLRVDVGTTVSYDLRAWNGLNTEGLPTDVVFSLIDSARYPHTGVSLDGDILTIEFTNTRKFEVGLYASSEQSGQTNLDGMARNARVFKVEHFRGRTPIDPDADADDDGFTNGEEQMLVDAEFEQHDALYQIAVGESGYIEISFSQGQWYLLHTIDSDVQSESYHATIADALAAAQVIIG